MKSRACVSSLKHTVMKHRVMKCSVARQCYDGDKTLCCETHCSLSQSVLFLLMLFSCIQAYRDGPAVLRRSSSYHGPRSSTVRTRSPSPVSVVTPVRRTVHSTYTPGLTDAELYEYLPTSTLKRNVGRANRRLL